MQLSGTKFFLLLLSCSLLFSCKKEEDPEPLPEATPDHSSTVFNLTLGGAYSFNETVHRSVLESIDGNYVLLGRKYDGQSDNMYVAKVATDGTTMWEKEFGGISTDRSGAIISATDGNLVAIGTTSTNPFNWVETKALVLKLNQNGDTLWSKKIGNFPRDEGCLVAEANGGYMAVLSGQSVHTPIKLIQLDLNGDSLWISTIDHDSMHALAPNSMIVEAGGNMIIAGESSKSGHSIYITGVNASGLQLWEKNIFDTYNSSLYEIIPSGDGNYIGIGYTKSGVSAQENVFLYKFDPNGNEITRKTLAAGIGKSIVQTPDGGFLINGFGPTGFYVLKIDSSLNAQWTGHNAIYSDALSILKTSSGDYLATYCNITPSYYLELGLKKIHLN